MHEKLSKTKWLYCYNACLLDSLRNLLPLGQVRVCEFWIVLARIFYSKMF